MENENREHMEIPGSELVDRIKQLIREGSARRIIIKKESGEVLFEIPLNAGVAVGGALVIFAPVLAAIGAAAAFLKNVKVEVIKADDDKE